MESTKSMVVLVEDVMKVRCVEDKESVKESVEVVEGGQQLVEVVERGGELMEGGEESGEELVEGEESGEDVVEGGEESVAKVEGDQELVEGGEKSVAEVEGDQELVECGEKLVADVEGGEVEGSKVVEFTLEPEDMDKVRVSASDSEDSIDENTFKLSLKALSRGKKMQWLEKPQPRVQRRLSSWEKAMEAVKDGKDWALQAFQGLQMRFQSGGLMAEESTLEALQSRFDSFAKVVLMGKLMELPFLEEMGTQVLQLSQEVARLRHGKTLTTKHFGFSEVVNEVLAVSHEINNISPAPREGTPPGPQLGRYVFRDGQVSQDDDSQDQPMEGQAMDGMPQPAVEALPEPAKEAKPEPTEEEKASLKKKRKNKKRSCPITGCAFLGFKLECHIKHVHASWGLVNVKDIPVWVKKGYLQKTSKKEGNGRQWFVCGEPGCKSVVNRPTQHLRRGKHGLTDAADIERARKRMRLAKVSELPASARRSTSTEPSQSLEDSSEQGEGSLGSLFPVRPRGKGVNRTEKKAAKTTWTVTEKEENKKKKESESESSTSEDEDVPYADSSDEELELGKPDSRAKDRMLDKITTDVDDALHVSLNEKEEPVDEQQWDTYYRDDKERKKTMRGRCLHTYYLWLMHVEGGEKKQIHSLQQVRSIHKMLEAVDPEGDGLRPLTHDWGMGIWNDWAAPLLRTGTLSHTTVKNYIGNLENFCKFLTSKRVAESLDNYITVRTSDLITRLPDWRKTINRRGATKASEKVIRETEEALTVKDIQAFERSEYVKRCVGIIEEVSRGQPCKSHQFVDVRDYLATILTLHNGSRTGVVENITIQHFAAGRKDRDGNFVVQVPTHKTHSSYGPARLLFKPHIYQYTKIYVEAMRSNFAGAQGSNLEKQISEVFKEAKVRPDIRVTATKIRKFHATSVFKLKPEERQFVHDHMTHSGKTAQAKYMRPDVVERSTVAFRTMQRNLRGEEEPQHKKEETEEREEKEDPKPKASESDEEEGVLSTLSSVSTRNITLTDEDKAQLRTLFKEEMNTNKKLSGQMIREKLRNNTNLRYMLLIQDKVRNVQRWICRVQKTQAPLTIDKLPEADPLERTANYVSTGGKKSSSLSSQRIRWSDEDTKIIRRRFQSLYASSVGKVLKMDINDLWQKDDVLRAIFEREETYPG